jgi:hypothetical protein
MNHSVSGAGEPLFEVVWPLGRCVSPAVDLAPPIAGLNGRTVCEFWGWVYRGDQMFPIINEELRKAFPDIHIVGYDETGDSHANNIMERDYVAGLPEMFRQRDCSAVIVGVGA